MNEVAGTRSNSYSEDEDSSKDVRQNQPSDRNTDEEIDIAVKQVFSKVEQRVR